MLLNMKREIMVNITKTPEETEKAGETLASIIKKERKRPIYVCLYGDLGAGKTAFVRGMARVLSPGSRVSSPTYSIVNEYTKGSEPFFHYDMYRISGEDDLASIGFFDSEGFIAAIEWSENIQKYLPDNRYEVMIEKLGEEERHIEAVKFGS